MTPQSALIRCDRCELALYLPDYFDKMTLTKIRKVFDLLAVEPWRNDEAHEKLQQFFPLWVEELEFSLEHDEREHGTAAQSVRELERQIACFGTMATEEMRAGLLAALRKVKTEAQRVKRSKAALERGGKVITAYNKILR